MKRTLPTLMMACLTLAACATDKDAPVKPKPLCPQVAIVRALEKVEDYGQEAIDPTTLVAVAVMQKVDGSCAYGEKGVDVTFDLSMAAQKGPRLGGNKVSFPFFVSVVSAEDKVLAKDMMTAEFSFEGDGKAVTLDQPLHIFLPLAKGEDAANIRVLTGFQLTEAQAKALEK
ncbi:MAG: hypothetical protein WC612_05980 [Bdellovibrionales bacterium]|jgi:hypothetical protein